jgi:MerR HTH family regulatory protein
MQGFRGPEVCRVTGLSYRRLDYWDRIGLVRPSVMPAAGSGSQRLYSADDVVLVKAILDLLGKGFSLSFIHRQLVPGLRAAIAAGQSEFVVGHVLDLAGLRARLIGPVAA